MKLKILFITGHTFGVSFIKGLQASCPSINITLLALHPKKGATTVGYSDARQIFLTRVEKAFYFSNTKDDIINDLFHNNEFDYCFCVGLSLLIPPNLLDNNFWIGCHPTLLPHGRGRAPLPWTILLNKKKSGITTFKLSDEADSGPIIHQTNFTISSNETATSLFQIVSNHHYNHGLHIGQLFKTNQNIPLVQQDKSEATYWGKRVPSDSHISSKLRVNQVDALIRAMQAPYPLPFIVVCDNIIQILSSKPSLKQLNSGTLFVEKKNILSLGFIDGTLDFECCSDHKLRLNHLYTNIPWELLMRLQYLVATLTI